MSTNPAPSGTGWHLTAAAFEDLLRRLSADERRAGAEYESLRLRLAVYFSGRGCRDAEVCADETLDRVARRLHQGQRIESVGRYARGVARLVALESLRRLQRERRALDEWRRLPTVAAPEETRLSVLEAHLQKLPSDAG